jgi:septum formation protein
MLEEHGFRVIQSPLRVGERPHRHGLGIGQQVENTLQGKVEAAQREVDHPCIIVADTLVEDPDDPLSPMGQPRDVREALTMLLRLSDRKHRVWSGTALIHEGEVQTWIASAVVQISNLSDDVLEALVSSGSWRGKAGGYDLAGPMGPHADLVEGDESTVLGFAPELFAALGNL